MKIKKIMAAFCAAAMAVSTFAVTPLFTSATTYTDADINYAPEAGAIKAGIYTGTADTGSEEGMYMEFSGIGEDNKLTVALPVSAYIGNQEGGSLDFRVEIDDSGWTTDAVAYIDYEIINANVSNNDGIPIALNDGSYNNRSCAGYVAYNDDPVIFEADIKSYVDTIIGDDSSYTNGGNISFTLQLNEIKPVPAPEAPPKDTKEPIATLGENGSYSINDYLKSKGVSDFTTIESITVKVTLQNGASGFISWSDTRKTGENIDNYLGQIDFSNDESEDPITEEITANVSLAADSDDLRVGSRYEAELTIDSIEYTVKKPAADEYSISVPVFSHFVTTSSTTGSAAGTLPISVSETNSVSTEAEAKAAVESARKNSSVTVTGEAAEAGLTPGISAELFGKENVTVKFKTDTATIIVNSNDITSPDAKADISVTVTDNFDIIPGGIPTIVNDDGTGAVGEDYTWSQVAALKTPPLASLTISGEISGVDEVYANIKLPSLDGEKVIVTDGDKTIAKRYVTAKRLYIPVTDDLIGETLIVASATITVDGFNLQYILPFHD